MKERPILFSAPMVRALLDGSKTQTRRVVKHPLLCDLSFIVNCGDGWWGDEEGEVQARCPYGQPGDRLWVREAWTTHACFDKVPPRDLTTRSIHYIADGEIETGKYRPPMFMPRWASRITLEITAVRIERLQDISETDALAEGIDQDTCAPIAVYRELWEQINGHASWDLNPWVWVIEFKKAPA